MARAQYWEKGDIKTIDTLFSLEVLFMARGPVLGKRRYKDDREDTRHGNAHGNSSNAGIYIGIPLYTRAYRLYMHC